ncbi:MAG: hypothetical protein WCT28_03365 [Patescibacteria group bacterium]|jgi:hypothetical protein
MQTILEKVKQYDDRENPYVQSVSSAAMRAISADIPLEFLSFTCSRINPSKLFSPTPWEYVSLCPDGNNFEADLPKLNEILNDLKTSYPIKLTIIIGNTDPYYIYLQQFSSWNRKERGEIRKRFSDRWEEYRNIFEKWIKERTPNLDVRVVSWDKYEQEKEKEWGIRFEDQFNEVYRKADQYFSKKDRDWEYRKLYAQFGPDKYFFGLERPSDEILNDWIYRKFTEYAVQGFWLQRAFPNAILIQNEKPTYLRSLMYQPLLEEQEKVLPIVHFLGIDSEGYA